MSNSLISLLCLFCVALVDLGTGQTKTFWADALSKGNTVSFLWRSRYCRNGSDKNLLGKGNSEPFLSRIGWFAHEYAECSEQREYCALFCVAQVGFNTVPFLCRLGWFVYGSDENRRDRGCDFFVST